MAQKTHIVLEYSEPKYWLPTFVTLFFICLLPILFVKTFNFNPTLKHKTNTLEFSNPELDLNLDPKLMQHKTETQQVIKNVKSLNSAKEKEHLNTKTPTDPNASKTIIVAAKRGDTLGKIFKNLGLTAKQLQEIASKSPQNKYLRQFKPGQKFEFVIQNQRVVKLSSPISLVQDLVIEAQNATFVGKVITKPSTPRYQSVTATIKGSIYSTAQRLHLSPKLIQQFQTIFARDPEFKSGLRTGDEFSILYKADFVNNIQVSPGLILAASYTSRGNTHEAIHYTNRDGSSSYYTPQGLSLKKGYDRYPIRFSHIASPFTLSRYHPVLHYKRPHYGIDLAAPIGTPIHAIGDGRITKIEYQGGYGNMIKIDHNNVYSTIYGHLSRFEKSMHRGKWVKRGEVIGYVGQTGLASGPHCHYEFHINQQPKNPTTIALPHADPISRKEMSLFKRKVHELLAALHRPRSNDKINTISNVNTKETV